VVKIAKYVAIQMRLIIYLYFLIFFFKLCINNIKYMIFDIILITYLRHG